MPGPDLTWTSWPVRDDWPRSLFLTLLPALAIALSFLAFGPLGWIALVVIALTLASYYAPTRYALDADGVRVSFLVGSRKRPWKHFRRYYPHRIGVHLSPFTKPSPLDPFRGTFLRFAGGNREEVLARLKEAGLEEAVREKAGAPPPEGPKPSPA